MKKKRVMRAITTWFRWARQERMFVHALTVSYMPGKSLEYRRGYRDALMYAEGRLGVLLVNAGVAISALVPAEDEEGTE